MNEKDPGKNHLQHSLSRATHARRMAMLTSMANRAPNHTAVCVNTGNHTPRHGRATGRASFRAYRTVVLPCERSCMLASVSIGSPGVLFDLNSSFNSS